MATNTHNCVYINCKNHNRKNPDISYFAFPIKDNKRAKEWQKNCGNINIASWDIIKLKNKVICEVHFPWKYIIKHNKRTQLTKTAVPYVFSDKAEMDDSNKQICRLCLEITPDFECEAIEDVKKKIHEVLHINMDFDISDHAIACNRCLERIQDCLEFKSYCSNFGGADVKDIEKVFIKEMISDDDICLKKPQVCQLCMCLIAGGNFNDATDFEDGVLWTDMMSKCFPELDIATVREICKTCVGKMKKYYEFMKRCEEVEQRIEHFCQTTGHGTAGSIILRDLLIYKHGDIPNTPMGIKTECLDAENVDGSVMEHVKLQASASIKSEEILIKDEIDYGEAKSSRKKKIKKKSSSKRVRKVSGKLYFCATCPYKTVFKVNLEQHVLKHRDNSEVLLHRCSLCPFASKYKMGVQSHWKREHDPTIEMYACKNCPFRSTYKSNVAIHQLTHHMDHDEFPKQVCGKCGFEANNKRNLAGHMKIHEEDVANKYECDKCSFSARFKQDLTNHQLQCEFVAFSKKNLPPDKMTYGPNVKFKCDECPFSSMYKKNLMGHQLTHKNAEETKTEEVSKGDNKKYKCEKCSYQNESYFSIEKHMILHSAGNWLSCDKCNYSTNTKMCMISHMRTHQGATFFHCHQCDFQTTRKHYLQGHINGYHRAKPFRCEKCEFRTWLRARLHRHELKHRELSETRVFHCERCSFMTKYKGNFTRHSKGCQGFIPKKGKRTKQKPKEPTVYNCEICAYTTKYKANFIRHRNCCLQKKMKQKENSDT